MVKACDEHDVYLMSKYYGRHREKTKCDLVKMKYRYR
jgi:hypothetical protein